MVALTIFRILLLLLIAFSGWVAMNIDDDHHNPLFVLVFTCFAFLYSFLINI